MEQNLKFILKTTGSHGRVVHKTVCLDLCFKSIICNVENELKKKKKDKTGDSKAKLADTIIQAKDDGDLNYGHDDGPGETNG